MPVAPITQMSANITLTRRRNALALFQAYAERMLAAGASPKGLEQAFAAVLQVSPSMWSQIKSSRPIGDKLARQIEKHCARTAGWLDEEHASVPAHRGRADTGAPPSGAAGIEPTGHALVTRLRAEVAGKLARHLQAQGWADLEIARMLDLPSPLASALAKGEETGFDLERLLTVAARAGLKPTLRWS